MGFLSKAFDVVSHVNDMMQNDFENKADKFTSGYASASYRASGMTDDELRSAMRRKADSGLSDFRTAGEFKAMSDEYKKRK